jgi:hypothetical protein
MNKKSSAMSDAGDQPPPSKSKQQQHQTQTQQLPLQKEDRKRAANTASPTNNNNDSDNETTGSSAAGADEDSPASAKATTRARARARATDEPPSSPHETSSSSNNNINDTAEMQQTHRVRAIYVLKRKHYQFRKAKSVLSRHANRLRAALVAERRPVQRMMQLRQEAGWRLVAPEHGRRALPHPARPTETLAADVDVYAVHDDDAAATAAAAAATAGAAGTHHIPTGGRLARRVPRYATIELKRDYSVQDDLKSWRNSRQWNKNSDNIDNDDNDGDVDMKDAAHDDDDDSHEKEESSLDNKQTTTAQEQTCENSWTRAEPFAIADPTLGKLDADFDPNKVSAKKKFKTLVYFLFLGSDLSRTLTHYHSSSFYMVVVCYRWPC